MEKLKNTIEKSWSQSKNWWTVGMRDFSDKMQQMRDFNCKNQGREPGRPPPKNCQSNFASFFNYCLNSPWFTHFSIPWKKPSVPSLNGCYPPQFLGGPFGRNAMSTRHGVHSSNGNWKRVYMIFTHLPIYLIYIIYLCLSYVILSDLYYNLMLSYVMLCYLISSHLIFRKRSKEMDQLFHSYYSFFFLWWGGAVYFFVFFRIHLNEFEDTRMNWGSAFFLGGEDLRMNWKTYQKKAEPQFIRVSSNSFRCMPSNSFVCLPIHSYVFSPKKSRNPNSFVCLPIHS